MMMNLWLSRNQQWLIQLVLILIVFIPIGLWLSSQTPGNFTNLSSVLRSIGQLCGLMGATLFSCNFILSARIGWIEEILSGLPKVYNLHHLFGGLAFILLLVHPVFLGLQYLPYSVSAAASFFLPNPADIPKLLGVLALGTLTTLLFITFFVRIAYHNWKATHQWLGLALVLASFHVYLMPGHLDSAPLLRGYMVTLMVAGIVAFGYRVVFGRWLVKRHPYTVDTVKVHGTQATEVRLLPLTKSTTYLAGQFFFLRVHTERGITREAHPFSFTSNPAQPAVSFAAKIAGDYTSTLPQLKKGMRVDIEGPYGRFLLANGGSRQVWIAGGIGITPFMSRARELAKDYAGRIHLYYVVKNRDQALFAEELLALARKIEGFSVDLWESDQQGRFTAENVEGLIADEATYFICGPSSSMADLKRQLVAKKVSRQRIVIEEFKLY